MKKLLLLIACFITLHSIAQDVGRCLAASYYTKYTANGEKKIYKPCSVCFTDEIFSFYTSEYGTITFYIEEATSTTEPSKDGMEQNFMSAESDALPRGWYTVDITYGNPKVVVINFPHDGIAIEIISARWLGEPENSSTGKFAFSGLKEQKNKKPDTNVNYRLNPILKKCEQITDIDISQYVNQQLRGSQLYDTAYDINDLEYAIDIGNDGKISTPDFNPYFIAFKIKESNGSMEQPSIDDLRNLSKKDIMLIDKIDTILIGMPSWHPKIKSNWVNPCQTTIKIHLDEKKKEPSMPNTSVNYQNSKPAQEVAVQNPSNTAQQSIQPVPNGRFNLDGGCYTVKGIIMSKERDSKMLIKLDKGQEGFLNAKNCTDQDSCLVLYFNPDLRYMQYMVPKKGEYVSCNGYLEDENGYMELKVIQLKVIIQTNLK